LTEQEEKLQVEAANAIAEEAELDDWAEAAADTSG
jgi:hypothetical protein